MRAAGIFTVNPSGFFRRLIRDRVLVLFILPAVIYYIVFAYAPMYGLIIAFKKYTVAGGILGSRWVGLQWFRQFFGSIYFGRLFRNTLIISSYNIIFGFPVPILFALLLNEVEHKYFKKTVQTVSYLPHFISTVVVVAMMQILLSPSDGAINEMIYRFSGRRVNFMMDPGWFRPLYVGSDIWEDFGWNSIIFLAAITGIDPGLYEAAYIDGSSRWKNMVYITIPCILPTMAILLILRVGSIMSVGYEKIILMYNEMTYETADVISTFTYRRGILNYEYSFAASVGLFNSVVNFALLITTNLVSKKAFEISLW